MRGYLDLLNDIIENGEPHQDRTGVGTLSVFGRQWRHRMTTFPLLTTKRVFFRGVVEELLWFLSGSSNEEELAGKGVSIWNEWATAEKCAIFERAKGDLGPVYGPLWRGHPVGYYPGESLPPPLAVDQIRQIYEDLEKSPESRRLIVSGWHPYYQKRVALPPCHTLHQLKVHSDNSLSLQLYARSIDCFLGLPFNIASYALLLSLYAFTTGRRPRDLIITFGDLHLYNNHLEQARLQMSRQPRPLPFLQIDQKFWRSGFEGLLSITSGDISLIGYDPHPKIEAEVAV